MAEWAAVPIRADVEVLRGDSWSWLASLVGDDDLPVALTSATAAAAIRSEPGSVLVAEPTVTVIDAGGGEWEVSLTDTQTAALAPGTYRWAARLSWPSGTVRTVVTGQFLVKASLVPPA